MESSKNDVNQEVLKSLPSEQVITFKKYYNQGRLLYRDRCQNCHGSDGAGLGRVIPPLAKADYIKDNPENLACLIRNGIKGEITVNGIKYNGQMPSNKSLSPLEIAEIITYIGNCWGNNHGLETIAMVNKNIEACRSKN